ncbi:MAG TPA: hypothetical protein VJ728_09805, partial [Candidatus Binataceae bacterium]|nr:hypothetical protein [Candidatus Binataceae bacterium]
MEPAQSIDRISIGVLQFPSYRTFLNFCCASKHDWGRRFIAANSGPPLANGILSQRYIRSLPGSACDMRAIGTRWKHRVNRVTFTSRASSKLMAGLRRLGKLFLGYWSRLTSYYSS